MAKRVTKLSDVLIPSKIESANQLAVFLSKKASLKTNPAREAVVIWFNQDESPGIQWTEMTIQDLDSLRRYLNMVVEDEFRIEWRDHLFDYDDDEGA